MRQCRRRRCRSHRLLLLHCSVLYELSSFGAASQGRRACWQETEISLRAEKTMRISSFYLTLIIFIAFKVSHFLDSRDDTFDSILFVCSTDDTFRVHTHSNHVDDSVYCYSSVFCSFSGRPIGRIRLPFGAENGVGLCTQYCCRTSNSSLVLQFMCVQYVCLRSLRLTES